MKLRMITEKELKGSKNIIHDTADVFGDLIQFVKDLGKSKEGMALNNYLKTPTPTEWERTKWIINSLVQKAMADPQNKDRAAKWANLLPLSGEVITASVFDTDPKDTRGTPRFRTSLSSIDRRNAKRGVGPAGWVGTMSNVGTLPSSRVRTMLKSMAQNGPAAIQAAKKDMPGIKIVPRF